MLRVTLRVTSENGVTPSGRSNSGSYYQSSVAVQPRPEMMLPEMRGGGSSRQSPVRNLIPSFVQQSPQDGAERSRSDKGSPLTPLSDLDLSGIDAGEFYAALARSLTNQ